MDTSSRFTQHHFVPETNQSGTRDRQPSTVTGLMATLFYRTKSTRNCQSSVTQDLGYGLKKVHGIICVVFFDCRRKHFMFAKRYTDILTHFSKNLLILKQEHVIKVMTTLRSIHSGILFTFRFLFIPGKKGFIRRFVQLSSLRTWMSQYLLSKQKNI